MKLDSFTRAYIECALWSSIDDDGEPLDSAGFGLDGIDPATLQAMIDDCTDFQNQERYQEISTAWTPEQAGHDFWLTRNRHGAGFWDRGLEHGDELSAMAKVYGSVDLYVGDDGVIYSS